MTETNHTLVVGADIGGAKAASGLVNRDGEIRIQTRIPIDSRSADRKRPGHDSLAVSVQRYFSYVVSRIAGNCRNSRILFSTWTGESGAPGISEAFR
jgi:hypothetical protein